MELQKKYNTKNITIENTIQTNGMAIDEEWAEFLAKNNFLVGLSLDGPKKIHDRHRRGVRGEPTFEKVMHTISLFDKYNVQYNILSVITNESAAKASYLYNFYKRNNFQFIQLIPCMDEQTRADSDKKNQYAVNPQQYGQFLNDLFDLWYEDFRQGSQMDIRMFSNLAQMAAGYPAEECGMNGCCTCYFVVEGDGSVYPCDFYCMDEWKLGTVQDSFQDLIVSDMARKFVEDSKPVEEKCQTCPHKSLCRGGCRRWRETTAGSTTMGLNYLCHAYEIFFAHTKERINVLGQYILKQYDKYTP